MEVNSHTFLFLNLFLIYIIKSHQICIKDKDMLIIKKIYVAIDILSVATDHRFIVIYFISVVTNGLSDATNI